MKREFREVWVVHDGEGVIYSVWGVSGAAHSSAFVTGGDAKVTKTALYPCDELKPGPKSAPTAFKRALMKMFEDDPDNRRATRQMLGEACTIIGDAFAWFHDELERLKEKGEGERDE